MKITFLEMGLLKIQAETKAESQAICGILEVLWRPSLKMPASVLNNHGCTPIYGHGKNAGELNYCVIPDGSMTGEGDNMKPGIDTNIKAWRKLPDLYDFKPLRPQRPSSPHCRWRDGWSAERTLKL